MCFEADICYVENVLTCSSEMKQDMSRAENYTPYAAYHKRWLRGGKLGVRGVSLYPLSNSNILLNEILASKKD
jgi:hypothetical protein